jgi:hypothetical protein
MKIAVCFYGQIRTGVFAVDNVKHYLGDLLPNIDFFVHSWDKHSIRTPLNLKLPTTNPVVEECTIETQEQFKKCYNPIYFHIDNSDVFYNRILSTYGSTGDLVYMWHSISQCLEYKTSHEKNNKFEYDYVLVIRPDIIYPMDRTLSKDLENHIAIQQDEVHPVISNIALFNDTFFLSNSVTANRLVDFYRESNFYGRHFWPPLELLEFAKTNNIIIRSLKDNRSTVLRPSATQFHILSEYWLINAVNAFIYEDINYAKDGGLRESYRNDNNPNWYDEYLIQVRELFSHESSAFKYLGIE